MSGNGHARILMGDLERNPRPLSSIAPHVASECERGELRTGKEWAVLPKASGLPALRIVLRRLLASLLALRRFGRARRG